MKPAILALFAAQLWAQGNCITAPCVRTVNFSWDSAGKPDSRPGAWGNADATTASITWTAVPAGYRVQVTRVDGDEIAAFHGGAPPPGTTGYVLVGLTNTTPFGDPAFTMPTALGCFLYYQAPVPVGRIPIGLDTSAGGLLNADNTMIVKQAQFLNDTGLSIHTEVTLVFQYLYVAVAQ
jgi:hypothetical protein